jgi:hypothetical protein
MDEQIRAETPQLGELFSLPPQAAYEIIFTF